MAAGNDIIAPLTFFKECNQLTAGGKIDAGTLDAYTTANAGLSVSAFRAHATVTYDNTPVVDIAGELIYAGNSAPRAPCPPS